MGFDQILGAVIDYHQPIGLIYVGSSDNIMTPLWPFARPKNTQWISFSTALRAKVKQQPQKFVDVEPCFELVSKASLEVDFYEASLGEFSGTTNPDTLKPYWHNIRTLKSIKRPAKTLDQLRDQNSKTHKAWLSANWLIVDQLAALDVLHGGQEFLSQLDGIIIKVALSDQSTLPSSLATSSDNQISQWLEKRNFKPAAQKDGRHKSFAHILFLRDWKSEHVQAGKEFEAKALKMDAKLEKTQLEYDEMMARHAADLSAKQQLVDQLALEQTQTQEKLEKQFKKAEELSKTHDVLQLKVSDLEAKTKTYLEKIEQLDAQAKSLTDQLKSVQNESLEKEAQAELYLQDLEFLRKKFKQLKEGDYDKVKLLKRVQKKLLAAVEGGETPDRRPVRAGDKTNKQSA